MFRHSDKGKCEDSWSLCCPPTHMKFRIFLLLPLRTSTPYSLPLLSFFPFRSLHPVSLPPISPLFPVSLLSLILFRERNAVTTSAPHACTDTAVSDGLPQKQTKCAPHVRILGSSHSEEIEKKRKDRKRANINHLSFSHHHITVAKTLGGLRDVSAAKKKTVNFCCFFVLFVCFKAERF